MMPIGKKTRSQAMAMDHEGKGRSLKEMVPGSLMIIVTSTA